MKRLDLNIFLAVIILIGAGCSDNINSVPAIKLDNGSNLTTKSEFEMKEKCAGYFEKLSKKFLDASNSNSSDDPLFGWNLGEKEYSPGLNTCVYHTYNHVSYQSEGRASLNGFHVIKDYLTGKDLMVWHRITRFESLEDFGAYKPGTLGWENSKLKAETEADENEVNMAMELMKNGSQKEIEQLINAHAQKVKMEGDKTNIFNPFYP